VPGSAAVRGRLRGFAATIREFGGRHETGNFFGKERLVDFLRREAASERPPPETVRRLVQAVMRHQRGVLQDDATVLLARWDAQLHPEQ
jgi:serine phosphatase RsbU (regulator of sigma subunit)